MSRLAAESSLQPGLYRLPEDPLGEEVLIPAFRAATSVRGAFGWFTAGWIGRLSPGLADYLNRSQTAPITFTVAPFLYPQERKAIEMGQAMTAAEALSRVAYVFREGRVDAGVLGRHALDCLAWMIATGQLCLRVAVPMPGSNYHPKVWLFDDGVHQVLVRGSANATGRGLDGAVEHMDVDVSWSGHGASRIRAGKAMLEDWESGNSLGIDRVVDMPEAIRQGILKSAPSAPPSRDDFSRAVLADSPAPNPAEALRMRLSIGRVAKQLPRLRVPTWLEWQKGTYAHQGEAVVAWEQAGERGTIAMATGAGKTLTALVCAARAQDRLGNLPFLVVISAPSIPLIEQWSKEISAFGVEAVTPTTASDSGLAITSLLRSLGGGGTGVAVVTNHLLCNPAFQKTLAICIATAARPVASMFIGDEAHTLGAKGFIANKPEFFERRLALSATPERQYDPDGTEEVFQFFGPSVYEFGLERAIGFCLVPYDYHVHVAVLDSCELDRFSDLTQKIRRLAGRFAEDNATFSSDEEPITAGLKILLIKRRKIIETAEAKLPLLRTVLSRRGPRTLRDSLVYASAKNPAQFRGIENLLTDLNVRWAPVTQETTANTRLLGTTLRVFADGGYQVLLAKKVLDEGVDIPSIREAFIVASSTVEREWIQRRGRILRLHPDKPFAVLHDFLALPPTSMVRETPPSDTDLRKIVHSELSRAFSFARHARNALGADGVLAQLEAIKDAYWPDLGMQYSSILRKAGDRLVAPSTPEGRLW